jgi:hypothetical protein
MTDDKCIKMLFGKPEVKNHLENLGADGMTILKRILEKHGGKMGSGLVWPR